jgi:hypothetical protein
LVVPHVYPLELVLPQDPSGLAGLLEATGAADEALTEEAAFAEEAGAAAEVAAFAEDTGAAAEEAAAPVHVPYAN